MEGSSLTFCTQSASDFNNPLLHFIDGDGDGNQRSRKWSHKGNIPTLPQTKSCPLCPAKFTRTTHVNRHLRSHNNDRSYRCSCGAEFTRSDLLARHKRNCGESPNTSPSRSRRRSCQACAQCKVKCDLQQPSCSRCFVRGHECIFVNTPPSSSPVEDNDADNVFRVDASGSGSVVMPDSPPPTGVMMMMSAGGSGSGFSSLPMAINPHDSHHHHVQLPLYPSTPSNTNHYYGERHGMVNGYDTSPWNGTQYYPTTTGGESGWNNNNNNTSPPISTYSSSGSGMTTTTTHSLPTPSPSRPAAQVPHPPYATTTAAAGYHHHHHFDGGGMNPGFHVTTQSHSSSVYPSASEPTTFAPTPYQYAATSHAFFVSQQR